MTAALLILTAGLEPAKAGCPCETNVDGAGAVNAEDVAAVADCANGVSCAACVNSCDVDCDGDVDWVDFSAVWCSFIGDTDCCNKPVGACTSSEANVPPCAMTYEPACTSDPGLFLGTWHGISTICVGDEVVDIPAISQWGLAALSLAVLIAGSVLLRSGRRVG